MQHMRSTDESFVGYRVKLRKTFKLPVVVFKNGLKWQTVQLQPEQQQELYQCQKTMHMSNITDSNMWGYSLILSDSV